MGLPRALLFTKSALPTAPRDPMSLETSLPRALFATAHTIPGGECNCLLHALRHAPGQTPKRTEAPNFRANLGQHVMGNLDATTGESSGESFRARIARDPASTVASTPEDYNQLMVQKQSRAFCGTLEIQVFVRFMVPGASVATYEPLPD